MAVFEALNYDRLDGAFHRFSLGERKIGLVAKSGEPLLLAGLRGDEQWVADRAWIEREGVRTVAAQPLVFRADILGVLALCDRGVLDGAALEWLRVFADYAAVSIANARAFEEIEGHEVGTLQSGLEIAAAQRIRAALEAAGGGRAEAAALLGIDRTTLFRWMKRLGL